VNSPPGPWSRLPGVCISGANKKSTRSAITLNLGKLGSQRLSE
jgi:hypothetical protein